jgi:hypothetical protein
MVIFVNVTNHNNDNKSVNENDNNSLVFKFQKLVFMDDSNVQQYCEDYIVEPGKMNIIKMDMSNVINGKINIIEIYNCLGKQCSNKIFIDYKDYENENEDKNILICKVKQYMKKQFPRFTVKISVVSFKFPDNSIMHQLLYSSSIHTNTAEEITTSLHDKYIIWANVPIITYPLHKPILK